MSDDSLSPASLEIDLAKSFQPSWAREADSPDRVSRLVAKHGDDDRPSRPGNPRSREQGPGRGRGQNQRNDRKSGNSRDQRNDRKGGRDPRNDRRDERREPPRPAPELQGWTAQIKPHSAGVSGLARQIKAGAKAYPLFDLARLVLEKSERYLVEFQRSGANSPALFQLRADGSLWLTETEAVNHALAQHLDKFYRRERVTVDPPKGNFSSVAVCGMSGELLGPSNHHAYQENLRRLHAARFSNMSFEAYKSRVRMEKDEAILARWKKEQSTRDVFYPITNVPAEAAASEKAPIQEAAPETGTPETVVPAEGATPEDAASHSTPSEAPVPQDPVSQDQPPAEAPPEDSVPKDSTTEETATESVEPQGSESTKLATLEEVARHFRANHAATEITSVNKRVSAPGSAALNSSSPLVHNLARRIWDELQRFPLPLAHVIGQQLTSQGLQVFKANDNITYASIARPHHLDRVATPVSEALSAMLEYIEANPSVPRAEQWKALVALRPSVAEGDEARRESATVSDLVWLLHGGHVIDFAGRGLQAARPPSARPPKKGNAPIATAIDRNHKSQDPASS